MKICIKIKEFQIILEISDFIKFIKKKKMYMKTENIVTIA